jgi:YD repeat-containing protein
MYDTTGYPTNWSPYFYSECSGGNFYIANYYAGSYSQSTTYTDGLGRTLQTQVHDSLSDVVSATQYDTIGRAYRNWRPYLQNTNHSYDASFQSHAQTYYNAFTPGIQNPFNEVVYDSTPLNRVKFNKPPGQSSSNEFVEIRYDSATVNGQLCSTVDVVDQPRIDASTKVISRKYTDKLGRVVKSSILTQDPGNSPVEIQASQTISSMLGLPTQVSDPRGLPYNNTYDFFGRPLTKSSPDAGTSKYMYDRAGRLRFMLDSAGIAANPDNTLYWKYDALGRVIEKGIIQTDWSAITSSNANDPTYPSSPSTWRKKYAYGTSQAYEVGRLLQVLTNNNNDNSAEVVETFAYDKYGNVLNSTLQENDYSSDVYSTMYEYDHLNRITKIIYPSKY